LRSLRSEAKSFLKPSEMFRKVLFPAKPSSIRRGLILERLRACVWIRAEKGCCVAFAVYGRALFFLLEKTETGAVLAIAVDGAVVSLWEACKNCSLIVFGGTSMVFEALMISSLKFNIRKDSFTSPWGSLH
jgi:hypothetical protein